MNHFYHSWLYSLDFILLYINLILIGVDSKYLYGGKMKGVSIIILLIVMLIVGMLVVKNYRSTPAIETEESQKVYIEKTKKAVNSVEKSTSKIKQTVENLNN